jgi:hypothetical protein
VTLIVMKRGGQPGTIAINPDLVTYVRSAAGPFTDIHFGEHHVSVEGSFEVVVARLTGDWESARQPAVKSWIKPA